MTGEEKQEIVSNVIQALKTNSATIDQLTEVSRYEADDYLELNRGRKISVDTLAKQTSQEFVDEVKELLSATENIVEETQANAEKADKSAQEAKQCAEKAEKSAQEAQKEADKSASSAIKAEQLVSNAQQAIKDTQNVTAQAIQEMQQSASQTISEANEAANEANAAAEAAREAAESIGEKQGAGKPVGENGSEVFNNLTDNSVEGAAYAHAGGERHICVGRLFVRGRDGRRNTIGTIRLSESIS